MKLSDNERKILAACELRGELSAPEIARQCGSRVHVVRYSLRRLREEGVISNPQPFINMYRLSLVEYQLHLSIGGASKEQRKNLVNTFLQSKRIAWLDETGGDFQYSLLAHASNMHDVINLLTEIQEHYGDIIVNKALGLRRSFTYFPRKLLSSAKPSKRYLSYSTDDAIVDKQRLNLKLLSEMSREQHHTLQDLADALKLPVATVDRHKKTLEQTKVIEGYFYRVDDAKIGLENSRIVVSVKSNTTDLRQKVFRFAQNNSWVVFVSESVGNWDYTLGLVTPDMRAVTDVCDELFQNFGAQISNLSSYVIYRRLKQHHYDFTED